MRTITTHTTVYKFGELSEEAQRKALENLYDINVSFDWWESTYEDAETIGCEIKGFDIDRGSYCRLACNDAHATALLIVENHGPDCDTRKLAEQYLKDHDALERDEDGDIFTDLLEALDVEFIRALGEEYLSLLRQEYEYQTSEEAVKETIECNEYDFTIEGRIF